MRISDWIQTCALPICLQSYDRRPPDLLRPAEKSHTPHRRNYGAGPDNVPRPATLPYGRHGRKRAFFRGRCWHVQRDRKRVVSGKSVSVSVDLGGRRIIKKNTKVYLRKTEMRSQ